MFVELARKDMERQNITLEDRDLAYLAEGSEQFADYVSYTVTIGGSDCASRSYTSDAGSFTTE